MAWCYDPAGPEWQSVDADSAARAIGLVDDSDSPTSVLNEASLEIIKQQIRAGVIVVVVNADGEAMAGPEKEVAEMIAKHEARRGFFDGGENE